MVTRAPARALRPPPTHPEPFKLEWPALRSELATLEDTFRSALHDALGACVPMCCSDYFGDLPKESMPDLDSPHVAAALAAFPLGRELLAAIETQDELFDWDGVIDLILEALESP